MLDLSRGQQESKKKTAEGSLAWHHHCPLRLAVNLADTFAVRWRQVWTKSVWSGVNYDGTFKFTWRLVMHIHVLCVWLFCTMLVQCVSFCHRAQTRARGSSRSPRWSVPLAPADKGSSAADESRGGNCCLCFTSVPPCRKTCCTYSVRRLLTFFDTIQGQGSNVRIPRPSPPVISPRVMPKTLSGRTPSFSWVRWRRS